MNTIETLIESTARAAADLHILRETMEVKRDAFLACGEWDGPEYRRLRGEWRDAVNEFKAEQNRLYWERRQAKAEILAKSPFKLTWTSHYFPSGRNYWIGKAEGWPGLCASVKKDGEDVAVEVSDTMTRKHEKFRAPGMSEGCYLAHNKMLEMRGLL